MMSQRNMSLRFGVLLVALFILVGMVRPGQAAGPAQFHPDPAALGLKPGEQKTVALRVDDVQDLYGLEFHLSFDPAVLEVVDADPAKDGVQIAAGDFLKGGFVAQNAADNAAGKINYALTLLNPAEPVSGGGVVVTLTLKGKAEASTNLKVEKVILANREAAEIPSQATDGQVQVSASGAAPVVASAGQTNAPAGGQPAAAQPAASNNTLLYVLAGGGVVTFLIALIVLVLVIKRRG